MGAFEFEIEPYPACVEAADPSGAVAEMNCVVCLTSDFDRLMRICELAKKSGDAVDGNIVNWVMLVFNAKKAAKLLKKEAHE